MFRHWTPGRRGLPYDAWQAWRADPRATVVLAWARSSEGFAVASPGSFAYSAGEGFVHVGWQEIERGGWNAETHRLSWTLYAASGAARRYGYVELDAPGRLPEVFRERVAASLVLERFVPLPEGDERGVIVAARRNPAAADPVLTWHSTLTRGVTWQTPGVTEFAEAALARLRAEWDSG